MDDVNEINNQSLNSSAWHERFFEKGFMDTTIENQNIQQLHEYDNVTIEIDSDSDMDDNEEYPVPVDPQPDSTNVQSNKNMSLNNFDTDDSSVISWVPSISLKMLSKDNISQPATSSQMKPDTTQPSAIKNKKKSNESNFQPIENEPLVFGKLITNEMNAITDPKILAKFKEQILKVIVDLNSGNL